jgi:hypothetical protein
MLVCGAPHGAGAASITNAQLTAINQDEFIVSSNLQQFYQNSQPLLNFGQFLPPALEQQTLTEVESELNNIIKAEQDELSVMQAVGVPSNLVKTQQNLIGGWGDILIWEQRNGVFGQPGHPPTAQAVLGVGYGLMLVVFQEEEKLYYVNENGFQVLPPVLYGEIQTLNSAFVAEQENLNYLVLGAF